MKIVLLIHAFSQVNARLIITYNTAFYAIICFHRQVGLEHGVQHEVLKVSAKTNTNIEKAFTCLAEQLVKVRGLVSIKTK